MADLYLVALKVIHAALSSSLRLIMNFRYLCLDIIKCKTNPSLRILKFLKLQPIIKKMAVVKFLQRTSCCVIELRGNNKIISSSKTQKYFTI